MADEKRLQEDLVLSNAPHIRSKDSVRKVMWLVVISLLPVTINSIYLFGYQVLLIIGAAVVTAVAAEAAYQFLLKRKVTALDGSAALTGLLLAMNVPPHAPVWMVVLGSVFAIIIAKQLFGGIGFNIFNPALAGRAFLMASWPVEMTTTWHPFSSGNVLSSSLHGVQSLSQEAVDTITSATPLGVLKDGPGLLKDLAVAPGQLYEFLFSGEMLKSLFMGNIGGCIGETSALFILIGAAFLLYKRIITWHIPVSYIGTVVVIMLMYYLFIDSDMPYRAILFHLLSGGLMLGAFYMATDMVTSPVTARGMIIFGAGCGIITSVIRLWGGYPEGVSYSILLMNAAVPLIDRLTKPRVFGTEKN